MSIEELNLHRRAARVAADIAESSVCAALGPRLTAARQAKGLPLVKVAVPAGMATHTLHYMERGKKTPRLAQLLRLADVLGVSVDWLLGRDTPAA